MKKYRIFGGLYISLFLCYCANVFNGTVFPNQCKRCDVVKSVTKSVIWSNEGCGSENTRIYEKAAVQAYELSRSMNDLCELEVVCEIWKREKREKLERDQ